MLSPTQTNYEVQFDQARKGTLELTELTRIGNQLVESGMQDVSDNLYQIWLDNTSSPLAYIACFNLGVSLSSSQKNEQAEEMYQKALAQNPQFIQGRINLGTCLEKQGKIDDAVGQWREALRIDGIYRPENKALLLHAFNNLGRVLESIKKYDEALKMLTESLEHDPGQKDVLLHLIHLRQKQCIWPLYKAIKGVSTQVMKEGTSPLAMLAASNSPQEQLAASKRFVEGKYTITNVTPLAPQGGYAHEKLRIGYLSSDLSMHAVSLLTVELYELHDRSRFEIYGFCWSHEDGTAFRQRVIKGFDHFIKIGSMTDKEAADAIRTHEIDILIDLQGLTSGARPLILSYRPAPVQATYLGFPGPTSLPWIDYVIADRYMIPEEEARYYSEKPLYLPNCFQVSDSRREVGPMPKRSDYSLPENAFVFCSFNNNYKYTADIFAVWMRILKRVSNSVLWLLADNQWAKANLCKAARKQGIKEERLIFAPRVVPADYLARYQLADLFLDTFPFNGGTTANDALFMGLPLLTLSGRTFASRYAGSLLTNLGVPELITTTIQEYEKKAIRLASKPHELKRLKERLDESRKNGVVFNTPLFVKNYEDGLVSMLAEKLETCKKEASKPMEQVSHHAPSDVKSGQATPAIDRLSDWERNRPNNMLMKVRYAKIIDRIRELRDPQYTVLEIGSGASGIAAFLERPVTGLNSSLVPGSCSYLTQCKGSFLQIDFPANQFDYVVCVDMLEHLTAELRERALAEMVRVARREVIVSCPCGKYASNFEARLVNNFFGKGRDIPAVLSDHLQHKLPDVKDILNSIHALGLRFEVSGNESLIQHYATLMLSLEFPEIDDAYKLQNIKSVYLPPVVDSGWDLYYSYLFRIPKDIRSVPAPVSGVLKATGTSRDRSVALYACFHKKLDTAYLGGITPIYSGALAQEAPAGVLTDVLSDGSSLLNSRWSELSAIYKIWKEGQRTDVIGFCHYSRLFNFNPEQVSLPHHAVKHAALPAGFGANIYNKVMLEGLVDGGIIAPKEYAFGSNNFDHYCHNHNTNDWLWVVNELVREYPQLTRAVLEQLADHNMHCWNMLVTSWEYFDELCSFWFPVLLKFEKAIPPGRSTTYQNRDISFIAERIFDIWLRYKKASGVLITELPIYYIEF